MRNPTHCTHCGRTLITVTTDSGYDPHTGKPTQDSELRCPAHRKPGLIRFISKHDAYWISSDGNAWSWDYH